MVRDVRTSNGLYKFRIGLGSIYINGATIDKNDISNRPVSQDKGNSHLYRRGEVWNYFSPLLNIFVSQSESYLSLDRVLFDR